MRAAEQDRPDVAAARRALRRRQTILDPRKLVFLDETSVSTTITRLYGRAPRGQRLVQKVLHGNWKTLTFIAALRHDRVTAPFVLQGAMNGETFKAYIEQFLAPTLKRGDIVFMDQRKRSPSRRGRRGHRSPWCNSLLPARVQSRLQSHRATICKAEGPAAEDCRILPEGRRFQRQEPMQGYHFLSRKCLSI